MRFIGTQFQAVDPKGRIVLPARFKKLLTPTDQDTMVLTVGKEKCLLLFPLSEWVPHLTESLESLPKGEARRNAIRTISDFSTELELDANGRLTIPREFVDRVGIEREVAIVGSLHYIEVWDKRTYEEGREARRDASSAILDQIL